MVLKDKDWITGSLVLTVILSFSLWSCNDGKQSSFGIGIQWRDSTATAFIIPRAALGDLPEDSVADLLKVHLVNGRAQPPVFGEYYRSHGVVVFEPLIPFTRGLSYEVRFRGDRLDKIRIPLADPSIGPSVIAVYPLGDTVPENLLKMHIRFSKPMWEANPLQYVHLLNGKDTLPGVFLDLRPALWNKDGTLLTLWLDPGRIKRELQPNRTLGKPLEQGSRYEFIIDRDWPGKDGSVLMEPFQKEFTAGPRDNVSPNVHVWELQTPVAGTRGALKIALHEALDLLLLQEALDVADADGNFVQGDIKITQEHTVINFIPRATWESGTYSVLCEARLEDLAGNNLNRLFEEDVTVKKTGSAQEIHKISFEIK